MAVGDCYHPQTILAYELNGVPLDVPHGAPLRLRFERQLGYKQAKYVKRIELVDSLAGIGGGKGGIGKIRGMSGTQESKVCDAWYVQPIGQSSRISWQSAPLQTTVNRLECKNANHFDPERLVSVRWKPVGR
jgi:DMSO/TMAO reductase YedYZ molybdopterin-dependent catalytic subunit